MISLPHTEMRLVFRVFQTNIGMSFLFQMQASRLFYHHQSQHKTRSSSFGIAFDIDGVILRGSAPIGGSPQALKRLYNDNGGGIPESQRAVELSNLPEVKILPSQVLQGHSPFRNLLERDGNQLFVATGKGAPAYVMSEYGFKKVLSIDEYASLFENIDPVSQTTKQVSYRTNTTLSPSLKPRCNVFSEAVKAAFVVSDPVDWGRDILVLRDILGSGGLPGQEDGHQPPLYIAADDLEYQAAFPSKRHGMGAFRLALESIFNRIHDKTLEYVTFGKPNPCVFKNAEDVLTRLQLHCDSTDTTPLSDNPTVDLKGAHLAGDPWFSILTRTGVFREKHNHAEFPADMYGCEYCTRGSRVYSTEKLLGEIEFTLDQRVL